MRVQPKSGWSRRGDREPLVQEVADDQKIAIIFAFKSNHDEGRLLVRPQNLRPDVVYEASSMDVGAMGHALGARLMQGGIELVHTHGSRAHVIVLTAQ